MRLIFRAGLVPDKLALQAAAADETENRIGRWIVANFSVKTVLEIVIATATVFGAYAHNESRLASIEGQAKADHALIQDSREQINRLNRRLAEEYVQRSEIESTARQNRQILETLTTGQQQLYTLLVQGGLLQSRVLTRIR
jgi:hypothetical protein